MQLRDKAIATALVGTLILTFGLNLARLNPVVSVMDRCLGRAGSGLTAGELTAYVTAQTPVWWPVPRWPTSCSSRQQWHGHALTARVNTCGVEAALEVLGLSPHDRELGTYLTIVRSREYEALLAAATENVQAGLARS